MLSIENVEAELKGTTLKVYWYILGKKEGRVGVREVQRALGLSSPSVAFHHLEKLRHLGLLTKTYSGEYLLLKTAKIGILSLFTTFRGIILPRFIFYLSFFITFLILYLLLIEQTLSIHNQVALLALAFSILFNLLESIFLLRKRPK